MTARSNLRALVIGAMAVLLVAHPVSADTCCANLPVGVDSAPSRPGDIVRLTGLECRAADNSGPLPLLLGTFWLADTDRGPSGDPDTTPGDGPPDFPPVEEWLAFTSVDADDIGVAAPGDATITVPALPVGWYQLWWWCDNGSGPGGGIHYSTGSKLGVGPPPDTATVATGTPGRSSGSSWPVGIPVAIGGFAFLVLRRWLVVREASRSSSC